MTQFGPSFSPDRPYPPPGLGAGRIDTAVLARFFNAVYAWMAAGLGITALVAFVVSTHPDVVLSVINPGTFLLLFVIEIALVATIAGAVQRIGPSAATLLFLFYAALNGITLSMIFLVYAHAVIVSAFVVTAGMFLATSLYGYLTRRDLTSMGAYLFMALIGLVLASVVSIFWHPTALTVAINYAGVLIFVGLTAYDTQRLKIIALQTANDPALASRLAISGALALYLDFLNLFLFILTIMGGDDRRR
jgi:FtsH-binding integral membrane protein